MPAQIIIRGIHDEIRNKLAVRRHSTAMFEKDHSQLWGNILRSLGTDMAMYAEMPVDPNMN